MENKLVDFLNSGRDWEKKATSIPGVFVLKLPPFKGAPTRLAVELNPVDSTGRPMKKRGVLLKSTEDFDEVMKILNDERLSKLLKNVDSVNPKRESKGEDKPDIIEI